VKREKDKSKPGTRVLENQSLFKRVLNDNYHVLNCLLPDERHYCYNLRDRAHNRELHIMSRLLDRQLFDTFTF